MPRQQLKVRTVNKRTAFDFGRRGRIAEKKGKNWISLCLASALYSSPHSLGKSKRLRLTLRDGEKSTTWQFTGIHRIYENPRNCFVCEFKQFLSSS